MKPFVILVVSMLLACEGDPGQSNKDETKTGLEERPSTQRSTSASRTSGEVEATAKLGDEIYQFNKVFCIGGFVRRVVITDTRKILQGDFPKIQMTIYDQSNSGGVAKSTVSFDFKTENGQRVLWQLDQGEVEQSGKEFHAQGQLRGSLMVTQEDGNDKPMPLAGENLKDFEVKGKC